MCNSLTMQNISTTYLLLFLIICKCDWYREQPQTTICITGKLLLSIYNNSPAFCVCSMVFFAWIIIYSIYLEFVIYNSDSDLPLDSCNVPQF